MKLKFRIATMDRRGYFSGCLADIEYDKCCSAASYILRYKPDDEYWFIEIIQSSEGKVNAV